MTGIALTVGHIARHTPHGAGAQGRDAAIVDIAQDLLLRHLHGIGVLDTLTFKGGTALPSCTPETPADFPSIWTSPAPKSAPIPMTRSPT